MVNRKTDRNHNQRCNRGQHGRTEVPRTWSDRSLNFTREDHALGSRSAKEVLPRIGQRFRPQFGQFLPKRSLSLRQLPSDQSGQLLVVKTAFATFPQMGLEIDKLRALQKAGGG